MRPPRSWAYRRLSAALLALACHSTGQRTNTSAIIASGAQRQIAIPTADGQALSGDLYGSGERGVVILAHGGYSSRESWTNQAETLAAEGFRIVVVEARAAAELAAGKETPCLYDEVCLAKDVLAAARHLRHLSARTISLMGGSMGGGAVAQASVEAQANEIERIVLLAPAAIAAPERMTGRKLFITTRDDANDAGPRLPGIQAQYARTPEPKQFVLLEGSAHAQRIFLTSQANAVMRDIVRFLKAP